MGDGTARQRIAATGYLAEKQGSERKLFARIRTHPGKRFGDVF